ncbi:sugar phosphate isomerase/epimerase family protein [Derxia gummosa]|uniref:Sugar phosphate isomerase/epimerase family protein n=1 Tax=Derxia gummosa DSM 723 TaxID=1121388 RepID=A0A8B6X2K3_9BURK|nr:sugar phosphate isomerase/epimerase family protein [Derxia gummosa]
MIPSSVCIDTIALGGTLDAKLAAITEAGCKSVMVWGNDLMSDPGGVKVAARKIRESGLAVAGFQLLRNIEAVERHLVDYKIDLARSLFSMMEAVGTDLLLVSSGASARGVRDIPTVGARLRMLADLGEAIGARIAYEALSWGGFIDTWELAHQAVVAADHPRVGLVIDSFHSFARHQPVEPLKKIPVERIFMVQLSDGAFDAVTEVDDLIESARHHRIFPHDGQHAFDIRHMVETLHGMGFAGPWAIEVFNDDYRHLAPEVVMRKAVETADWLRPVIGAERA